MIWARVDTACGATSPYEKHTQFYDTTVAKCYNLPLWCESDFLCIISYTLYRSSFLAGKAFHVPQAFQRQVLHRLTRKPMPNF